MDSLRAKLLIASPGLLDPNFRRTVVLIAEHSPAGALGFVLNRPAGAEVADAVPALEGIVDSEEQVFFGGPVQRSGVILLAQFDDPAAAARIVFDDVGFLAVERDVPAEPALARRVRVFAGHSGWGPDQLEAELEREDWIVEPAVPDDIFAPADGDLWSAVLDRKGGQFSLLARMPPDPSLN